MNTSKFNNSELLKQVEQTFNVSIYQDTNYSDQSDKFYRFDVCKDKNSPVIGRITCRNGKFEGGVQRNFDGTYSQNELLNNIADFMNKNNAYSAPYAHLVGQTVIVIHFPDGDFLFGMPYKETIEFSSNIQWSDKYDSVEDAQKNLELFNSFSESKAAMNGSVKKFSYEIDEKCLTMPTNIEEVK